MIGTNKIDSFLYKTIKQSLLYGKVENREEMINNFLEIALKIDIASQKEYEENLEKMFYTTTTLEDEAKKLENLISFIKTRVSNREELVNDFRQVTHRELEGLAEIEGVESLNQYVHRLQNIHEYLVNTQMVKDTEEEIKELNNQLENELQNEQKSKEQNNVLEDNLVDIFKKCIKNNPAFSTTDTLDIDFELTKIGEIVAENRKTLNIFNQAYSSLKDSGIPGSEISEYESYVQSAKLVYYEAREKEILLTIYKLLINKEVEYTEIFMKRDKLLKLLDERLTLRNQLGITSVDEVAELYRTVKEQYVVINAQKVNANNISNLRGKIDFKSTKLENLKAKNKETEILKILAEYNIKPNENKDIEEIKFEEDKPIVDVLPERDIDSEIKTEAKRTFGDSVRRTNEVSDVRDSEVIKFTLVSNKARDVMLRVAKMLGIEKTKPVVNVQTETAESSKMIAFPTGFPNADVEKKESSALNEPEAPVTNNIEPFEMPSIPITPAVQSKSNPMASTTSDLVFPELNTNNGYVLNLGTPLDSENSNMTLKRAA